MKSNILKRKNNLGLLILRLIVGGAMLLHGISKLMNGIPYIVEMVTAHSLPTIFAYGVYVGEVIAPLLILLGFRTRLAALVFAFNCFVAWYLTSGGVLFGLNEHGGWVFELLGLYFFGAVALFFTGGGKYAVSSKSMWD